MNRQRSRGRLAVDERARRAAAEHRADDEHRAEHERLVLAGRAADEPLVAEPDAEHEQRAELGEPRQLLDGRLADALVVALVEAEDLRRGDDRREQQQRERRQRVGRRERDADVSSATAERAGVGERQRAAQSRSRTLLSALRRAAASRHRRVGSTSAGRVAPARRASPCRSISRPFVGYPLFKGRWVLERAAPGAGYGCFQANRVFCIRTAARAKPDCATWSVRGSCGKPHRYCVG